MKAAKTAGTLHEDHDGASHSPFYHWSVGGPRLGRVCGKLVLSCFTWINIDEYTAKK